MLDIFNATEKALTAATVKETIANIIALQEVENLDALCRFRQQSLN
jgi:hypothetical protein